MLEVLPPLPPPEVVAEISLKPDEEPGPVKALSVPPSEVVAALFTPSTPRIKGNIAGYSDESDDNESDHSVSDDASDDEEETNPKVQFLPPTLKGLCKRFNKLFCEFMQQKHEHRNELVFLLDELVRQEVTGRDKYKQLNNILSEFLDSDDVDSEPDEYLDRQLILQ